MNYDIIFLSEVKCMLKLQVPGFETYRAKHIKGAAHRGGLAALIKPYFIPFLKSLDQSVIDQIWIETPLLPKTIIGGVYIPPPDSKYHDLAQWADLQANLYEGGHKKHLFLGDMNAHIENPIELADNECVYVDSIHIRGPQGVSIHAFTQVLFRFHAFT